MKTQIAFVSGHLDVTDVEFAMHYAPRIEAHAAAGGAFVVADSRGADTMAQELLSRLGCADVVVFHIMSSPRVNAGHWPTSGGYALASECDAAMTRASDLDIAWVRPGREKSNTARNIRRRNQITDDAQAM